ncbi:MAG: SDR family NAD(P)-dependent oxidoreductase [Thermodesulfobacteriota bacterium]
MDYLGLGKALGLYGKVAVIAGGGGAKNGIGRATAVLFAKMGARVAVLDINREAAAETARQAKAFGEAPPLIWQVDVTDEEEVDRVVKEIIAQCRRIDVWAHIAGGHRGSTLIEEIPPAVWRASIELNLTGAFLCSRAVLPVMKKQRQGKIVLISSSAGRRIGSTSGADYASAKAGIVTFTKQLAFEGDPFNINVNAVAPGPTHAPNAERDRKDNRLAIIPLQRPASPEDQAKAIVFLASNWADMITGVTLDVDGGMYFAWMDYETYLAKHKHP